MLGYFLAILDFSCTTLTRPCNVDPPNIMLLYTYSKTKVYIGKHNFIIFASKHRLCVFVRRF